MCRGWRLELGIRTAVPEAGAICYVEREAFAAACLVARMESGELHHAPVWSDLTTFDARPWRGVVDCVASGDPCQPNSVAGRGEGEGDDRFLADQVIRIVAECRPDTVFRENVTGNAVGQLRVLVPALERLGYRVAAGIFSASEVGASHRRERLFIMAKPDSRHDGRGEFDTERLAERRETFTGSSARSCKTLADANGRNASAEREQRGGQFGFHPEHNGDAGDSTGRGQRERGDAARSRSSGHVDSANTPMGNTEDDFGRSEQQAQGARSGRAGPSGDGGELANACDARSQGREQRSSCDDERHRPDAHGSTAELCRTRLPVFAYGPSDPRWQETVRQCPELEPALCRMADGLANRVDRLRATGNGVVPLAAAFAWDALSAAHDAAERDERTARQSVLAGEVS